jgi:hypothetical protein
MTRVSNLRLSNLRFIKKRGLTLFVNYFHVLFIFNMSTHHNLNALNSYNEYFYFFMNYIATFLDEFFLQDSIAMALASVKWV